jgi:ATP-dependent helicase HrpA
MPQQRQEAGGDGPDGAVTVSPIAFPADLPVAQRREEIAAAIASHQVTIVQAETGSGKTTQLPKICLAAGRAAEGPICLTQPRRIAARSVATRIASELGTALGSAVGYQVRFDSRAAPGTSIRVLTDGVLLAQLRKDPLLSRYGTIIIDEAHERSLNIDFLLGCLVRICARRPELRVIVASATIDAARIAAHFGNAPVLSIGGRLHPVEVRWRPPPEDQDDELVPSVCAAVGEALESVPDGDVLAFLPGEREILECAEAMRGMHGIEVLPLYSRIPESDQDRIFAPSALRRVILATNIAETSVTVPRVRAVVDSGLARVKRFSSRSRIQRLPVEPISQASAMQRAGRCGRTGPGVCIRLYDELSLSRRPEWAEPEIRRTNLASVLLQMESLGLGAPESFPFIDPPSPRAIEEGRHTLMELGAFDANRRLTASGRRMARLPIDPRLSRMVIEAMREGCLDEAIVVAAALSVQDPRERPSGQEQSADAAHVRWKQPDGDFAGLVRLWKAWSDTRASGGSGVQRRWCRDSFLSHRRMREWVDVHAQLTRLVHDRMDAHPRAGPPEGPARMDSLHRCVLAGFLFHAAERTRAGEYVSAGGARFRLHPSSALGKSLPRWIVVAEIVETTRRWGRLAARIRPAWVELVAPHAVHRITAEPHWVRATGQVAAWQRVTLGALTVMPRRPVPYGPLDPSGARDIFIQNALVDGLVPGERPAFMDANDALRESIERIERRERRPLLADAEARTAFYDARVPAHVHSWPSLMRWMSAAERENPLALRMSEGDLLRDPLAARDEGLPESIDAGSVTARVMYEHSPGAESDGATVRLPLAALAGLDVDRISWGLPGHLVSRIESLIRTLPKHARVRLQPAHQVAEGAAESLAYGEGPLVPALAAHCSLVAGMPITAEDFSPGAVDPHLSVRVEVIDDSGNCVASGRDIDAIVRAHAHDARQAFAARAADAATHAADAATRAAPDGDVPESLALPCAEGATLTAHCALPSHGARVPVTMHPTAWEAFRAHREAVVSHVAARIAPSVRRAAESSRDWIAGAAMGGSSEVAACVARRIVDEQSGLPRSVRACAAIGDDLRAREADLIALVADALRACAAISQALAAAHDSLDGAPIHARAEADAIADHLATLVPEGVLSRERWVRLSRLATWISAVPFRVRRMARGPQAPAAAAAEGVALWLSRSRTLADIADRGPIRLVRGCAPPQAWAHMEDFRDLVEEHVLSVHAQDIPTSRPAGASRLERAWSALTKVVHLDQATMA